MQRPIRFRLAMVLCAVIACGSVGIAMLSQAHAAGNANPVVAPPGSNPYGASYGEWSAAWWRWAISMPIDASPLMETADCSAGQSGPVWFLGGSFVNATVVRDCTIPAGMPIFLPVLNAECSTVEPPPFHGDTEAELRACAVSFIDATSNLFASVDGRTVQNLGDYRVQSPLYSFSAPANNVLFVPGPVTGQSVSDGVWLFLHPLSAGQHTLRFGGTFTSFNLTLDVTYNITVLPGGRGRGHVSGGPGDVETTWGVVKELFR